MTGEIEVTSTPEGPSVSGEAPAGEMLEVVTELEVEADMEADLAESGETSSP